MEILTNKTQINVDFICVLKFDEKNSRVEVSYSPIKLFFTKELAALEKMCKNENSSLLDILYYIEETPVLLALNKSYRYCEEFDKPYQEGIQCASSQIPMYISNQINIIRFKKKVYPVETNLRDEIQSVKDIILFNYEYWINAYCMDETHKQLDKEDFVLAFSHKKIGWSKRPHNLTPDFSVQIDTNFGYGRSSYFFSKLTYKKIDLIPFSEWVEYRYANFFEIIRYTAKYDLRNECWHQAMEFCRDACNLSLSDETMFVEKYIVSECEKMVNGLESFLTRAGFTLKDFQFDKSERILIEFRGEKISGALDFIEKILEFKNIFAVNGLILRIEKCNRIIQPILAKELVAIAIDLEEMSQKMGALKPVYLALEEKNQSYNKKREVIKKKLMIQDRIKDEEITNEKIENVFLIENPEYKDFLAQFTPVNSSYIKLLGEINAITKTQTLIAAYNKKIINYLNNKYLNHKN